MRTSAPYKLLVFCSILFWFCSAIPSNATERSYVPLSLSYAQPTGPLAREYDAKSALGFSIGYQYGINRHWFIGARGTWMVSNLGFSDTSARTPEFSFTHYQMMLTATYHFIKNGVTPYIQAEGGLGVLTAEELINNVSVPLEHESMVQAGVATSVGLLIPLNDKFELDIHGRIAWSFIANGYGTTGIHAGIIYALPIR